MRGILTGDGSATDYYYYAAAAAAAAVRRSVRATAVYSFAADDCTRLPRTYLYPIPVLNGPATHVAATTKPTATVPVALDPATSVLRQSTSCATTEMGNTATSKKGDANENGKQLFDTRSTTAEHAVFSVAQILLLSISVA